MRKSAQRRRPHGGLKAMPFEERIVFFDDGSGSLLLDKSIEAEGGIAQEHLFRSELGQSLQQGITMTMLQGIQ
jgi:hypothetical protein